MAGVRIVSVVSNDVPVHNAAELQSYCQSGSGHTG